MPGVDVPAAGCVTSPLPSPMPKGIAGWQHCVAQGRAGEGGDALDAWPRECFHPRYNHLQKLFPLPPPNQSPCGWENTCQALREGGCGKELCELRLVTKDRRLTNSSSWMLAGVWSPGGGEGSPNPAPAQAPARWSRVSTQCQVECPAWRCWGRWAGRIF